MKPEDLSVVLTGATGRIGVALARLLVARGARVLLVARTAQPLVALARELGSEDDHRHRIDALAADVKSAVARQGIRDAAVARQANVLVNAAHLVEPGTLLQIDPMRADAMLQTNLLAPIQLTRALLPHLMKQPAARLLYVAPGVRHSGLPDTSVAATGQIGLRGFCEALRRELRATPVRAQFLSPGELPDEVARAALRMLLNGKSERFLGLSSAAFGRFRGLVPF